MKPLRNISLVWSFQTKQDVKGKRIHLPHRPIVQTHGST